MANYDQFAPFYDAVMGDRSDVTELLGGVISRLHPHARTMLELGCGTGSVLAAFEANFELFGIDLSGQMLKIAQQKLPRATFKRATIAGFELHQQFDVIICVFDTINHLSSFADWQKLFASAKKHLSTNGLFIFDMDTIERFQALGAYPGYTQDADDAHVELLIKPMSPNAVEWHVTIEKPGPDGIIETREEHVQETGFPLEQVTAALQAHFEILETFDSSGQPPKASSDRIYFVCR